MTLAGLAEMRRQGELPKGLILISLVNALDVKNTVLRLRPDEDDFRALVGLDVEVIHNGAMVSHTISIIGKLAASGVQTLSLTNIETKQRILVVWCGEKDICDITRWPVFKNEEIRRCKQSLTS